MIDKRMNDLETYVNEFRRLALEQAWVSDFPRGVCGDASEVLGALLLEHGYGEWELIRCRNSGSSEETPDTHAWIRQDQTVVDVTYDQFTDMDRCFDPNAELIQTSEIPLRRRFPKSLGESRSINLGTIGDRLPLIYRVMKPRLAHLASES